MANVPGAICSIEGCDKPKAVRGMCHKHYARWQRHGDPLFSKNPHAPYQERFWRYVTAGDPSECWEWQGFLNMNGYGRLAIRHRNMRSAHRVSYEMHKGPIPEGLVVMHMCDNPRCVNPHHLEVGTQKDNTHDMMRKGRGNWRAPKGEESPTAKITEAQARRIKFGNEMGVTVARDLGISPCTVSAIRKGRLWAHLSP